MRRNLEVVRLRLWEWKKVIAMTIAWYMGLVYFRDELLMGEFYLLASGFWVIYLIGFSPRELGELSAYSHFNRNHERLLGDLDPRRAGRELTGQILFDDHSGQNSTNHDYIVEEAEPSGISNGGGGGGYRLGRADNGILDQEDADLQRALLLSLREERETRRKNQ